MSLLKTVLFLSSWSRAMFPESISPQNTLRKVGSKQNQVISQVNRCVWFFDSLIIHVEDLD